MAKKLVKPENVFQQLLKAVEALAGVHGVVSTKKGRPKKNSFAKTQPQTEFTNLKAGLDGLEAVKAEDILKLAQTAIEQHKSHYHALAVKLEELREQTADFEKRRRELASKASTYDWKMVHRDKEDFIGPFKLIHDKEFSRVLLDNKILFEAKCPSGSELFDLINDKRHELERSAKALWPKLRTTLCTIQDEDGNNRVVTWTQLAKHYKWKGLKSKQEEIKVLFNLVMLQNKSIGEGWSISTRPPSLDQQSGAFNLPCVDKPSAPIRVYAFRISCELPTVVEQELGV